MTLHKITAPVPGYTGTVAGVALANGTGETDSPSAVAYFRRHGYGVEPAEEPAADEESDAPFDPAAHTVDEVAEYLAEADEAERDRVLDAEAAGKARSSLLKGGDS